MVRGALVWRQFEKLIAKNFHEASGFSKEELERLLPDSRKENGLLVVSESCLNLHLQAELLGIASLIECFDKFNLNDHRNIMPVPPGLLYWIYDVDDGRATLKLSNEQAMAVFKKQGRVACVTAEVLAIYRENPEILHEHFIDIAGSRIGPFMPGLCLDEKLKRPELVASDPDSNGFNRWGAASRSAE